MLTNQVVINAFYQAAEETGQNGWNLLHKAGLTFLTAERNAPYSGPDIEEIHTLSSAEKNAIFEKLPLMLTDEMIFTNQDIINAFYAASEERSQEGWTWLSKAGLTYLADNREALYSGPDLSTVQGFSGDEKALITSYLNESQPLKNGQTVFEGATYTVQFFTGDYGPRQRQAIAENCVAYVEQHFNSGIESAQYSLVIIPDPNPFSVAQDWAQSYANRVAQLFGTTIFGDDGIKPGGFEGRGNGNIKVAGSEMPALLLESLFASHKAHAAAIRTEVGQDNLADSLVESIRTFFPGGGKIAFSVGHKYKISSPTDRGVPLHGGGMEADYAEKVLLKAARKLQSL